MATQPGSQSRSRDGWRRFHVSFRGLLLTVFCLALAACTDPFSSEDLGLRQRIARQLDVWSDQEITSYSYEIRRRCFCAFVGWVRVEVVDDSVVSITPLEDDFGAPVGDFPTINGLFNVLVEAVDQDAHSIDVNWDETFGHPTDFFIDYSRSIADEELGYEVGALTPAA